MGEFTIEQRREFEDRRLVPKKHSEIPQPLDPRNHPDWNDNSPALKKSKMAYYLSKLGQYQLQEGRKAEARRKKAQRDKEVQEDATYREAKNEVAKLAARKRAHP